MRFVYIRSGLRLLADTLAPIGLPKPPRVAMPSETCAVNVGLDAKGGVKAKSATRYDVW
jgi:hypothetical protein